MPMPFCVYGSIKYAQDNGLTPLVRSRRTGRLMVVVHYDRHTCNCVDADAYFSDEEDAPSTNMPYSDLGPILEESDTRTQFERGIAVHGLSNLSAFFPAIP